MFGFRIGNRRSEGLAGQRFDVNSQGTGDDGGEGRRCGDRTLLDLSDQAGADVGAVGELLLGQPGQFALDSHATADGSLGCGFFAHRDIGLLVRC